jgi:hypothetical protein
MFLRECDALLTVQLAIGRPAKERPTKEPVLRIGERESSDRFLKLIPFILRVDVQASLETAENYEVFVGDRRNTFA